MELGLLASGSPDRRSCPSCAPLCGGLLCYRATTLIMAGGYLAFLAGRYLFYRFPDLLLSPIHFAVGNTLVTARMPGDAGPSRYRYHSREETYE